MAMSLPTRIQRSVSHCDLAWAGALATCAHTEKRPSPWGAVALETCWFDGRDYHPYKH